MTTLNQDSTTPETREFSKLRRTISKVLFRSVAVLMLLTFAFVFYLSTKGFPEWLASACLTKINAHTSFVIEADGMKIAIPRGVVFDDTKVYRKGVVGPAAIEASRITVLVDPIALWGERQAVRRMVVRDGLVRPWQLLSADDDSEADDEGFECDAVLQLVNCKVFDVLVEDLTCRLKGVGEPVLTVDGISSRMSRESFKGPVSGHVSYNMVSGALEGELEVEADPRMFVPVLETFDMPYTSELVQRFAFDDGAARYRAKFACVCNDNWTMDLKGEFWLQDFSYRGVPIMRADGALQLMLGETNSLAIVKPLFMVRRHGGIAEGGIEVDITSGTVAFEGRSSMDPVALTKMVGVLTNGAMDHFDFEGANTRAVAKGIVDFENYDRTVIDMTADSRDLKIKGFDVNECSFTLRTRGHTNLLSDIKGKAHRGEFGGHLEVILPRDDSSDFAFAGECEVDDVDFGSVMKVIAKTEINGAEHKGKMGVQIVFKGNTATNPYCGLSGAGRVTVNDGRIFMLPVFGGLSQYLTKIIPGLDFVLRQSDLSAGFVMGDGKIHTDVVHIKGDVLSLSGDGDYYLDERLDFDVQVRLMKEHTLVAKLLRVITYPISRLFEFRLEGTRDDPQWSIFNFPADILRSLGLMGAEKSSGSDTEKRDTE